MQNPEDNFRDARSYFLGFAFGAFYGTRTCDLLITNELLYQLS